MLPGEDFTPGDCIVGTVVCMCDKSFNCNRVTLVLHGEEISRVVHGSGKSRHVHKERREHVNQELELSGPCEVPEGDSSYEFSVFLPSDLPGSFTGLYGNIEYTIKANVEISRALDKQSKKVINVRVVPPPPVSKGDRMTLERDGVSILTVEVENGVLRPGQAFPLRFLLSGSPRFRGVRVQIITRESVAPQGVRTEHETAIAEAYYLKEEIPEETWIETVLEVPTACPPPFKTELIELAYWLKVTLDIPLRTDQTLFMPLHFSIVGHRLGLDTTL